MMKIDLYCNDGSPLGVTADTVWERGVGGAELSLVNWAAEMAERKHQVTVYNDPKPNQGYYGKVEYRDRRHFQPFVRDRDVFIAFRSPNPYLASVQAKKKIFWSCDQYTIGDFSQDIFPYVDHIVCISPFHVNYFRNRYNAPKDKLGYFDLGVNLHEYTEEITKIKNRFIYCSVPDRGLSVVAKLWPKVLKRFPDATLIITSDYTLWGASDPRNHQYKLQFSRLGNVEFKGNIPRKTLIEEQKRAEIMLHPCIYDELFCISAAECLVAGTLPITSSQGALSTTNFGLLVDGDPNSEVWQNKCLLALTSLITDEVGKFAEVAQTRAKDRFDWIKICDRWEILFKGGKFS